MFSAEMIENVELQWMKVLYDGFDRWENNLKIHLEEMNKNNSRVEVLQQQLQQIENEAKEARSSLDEEKKANCKLQSELQATVEIVGNMQKQRDALIESVGKELNAQTRLVKANYEVSINLKSNFVLIILFKLQIETLRSNVKLLEREIGIQKVEYEKLKTINKKLQRDSINFSFN